MQTASLEKSIPVSAGNSLPPATAASFVINLTSSTTPVALTRPDHAGLKRFTFFVSRRREEGRERFRLHMGYFPNQEEAEKLLDIVREFYPGAWASPAPGQRLRAAAAATAAPTAPTAERAAEPAAPPAPTIAPATHATVPRETAERDPSPQAAAPLTLALVPDVGRQLATDAETTAGGEAAAALALTSVRAAIASLDDAPTVPPVNVPELKPAVIAQVPRADVPVVRPAKSLPAKGSARSAAPVAKSAANTPEAIRASDGAKSTHKDRADKVLNDAEALQVLEKRTSAEGKAEPACFAVQLMWSVQPIDMGKVPQLAIFSAYTLYAAEGNRNGRCWYGLRLGFFTDAVSAKQVAQYVRSEFSTVSIVPVTGRERERAKSAAPVRPAPAAAAPKNEANEFAFIDDKPAAVSAPVRSSVAPGKRAKLRSAAPKALPLQRKSARKELSLEETLEILGADQLQMQVEGSEHNTGSTSESGVRHLQLQQVKGKPSRLGRLMNRLSGLDKD
jgi:hypothetical protein